MLPKSAKICRNWQLHFRSFHWGPNLILKIFSSLFSHVVLERQSKSQPKTWLFLTRRAVNKDIKSKTKKNYRQPCSQYSETFRYCTKFSSTAGETKRDCGTKYGIYVLPH